MVACTPHPGLGTIRIQRPAIVQVVDLGTCRERTIRSPARPPSTPGLKVVATRGSQSIVYRGRTVLTVREDHSRAPAGMPGPILLEGMSPDRRWILYAIDPQGSASLAADGLTLRAVSASGGRSHTIATGLLGFDYRGWCDGKLAMTAGGDRYAAHHKWLVVAEPPSWHVRRIAIAPAFAFGALACRGDGIVVQATRDRETTAPAWALWDFGLEGGMSVLDTPPRGTSDESPRVARDGTIYFVRTRGDSGKLFALRGGKLVGPLVSLGRQDGFFGHRAWPYSVSP